MQTKWIIFKAGEAAKLEHEISNFCKTNSVKTSHDNYGELTIEIDGKVVSQIQSVEPLMWRVPLHMLTV